MAIDADAAVGDAGIGLYLAFRTPVRGGAEGHDPVGTLNADAVTIGDGSGGSVQLGLTMREQEFGFRPLWVPTHVMTLDTLATVQNVRIDFAAVGNRRLIDDASEGVVPLEVSADLQIAVAAQVAIVIEPSSAAGARVLRAVWGTNVNLKAHTLRAYGPVYDQELMARHGTVPDLVAGLR